MACWFNAAIVIAQEQDYIVEDLQKPGAVQGIKRNFEQKFDKAGGTITGGFTVRSGGVDIILSTNALTNSIKIDGATGEMTSLYKQHNSSQAILTSQVFTNTLNACIGKSTVTITTTGGSVAIYTTVTLDNNDATAIVGVSFKQDGVFVAPLNTLKSIAYQSIGVATEQYSLSFFYILKDVLAGSHQYCLAGRVNVGTGNLRGSDIFRESIFGVIELK